MVVWSQKYDYSRSINPNREALETLLASLEHGSAAIAYSSGSAATAAICQWLTLPIAEGGGRKGSKRDEVRILSISDVVSSRDSIRASIKPGAYSIRPAPVRRDLPVPEAGSRGDNISRGRFP